MPLDFDENDMKRAKQVVLKTHPDKSKLTPEYFIFYSKAYKMVHSIWEFRKKGDASDNMSEKNTEYVNAIGAIGDKDKKVLLDNFFESNGKFKNKKDFNSWFNEQFDKNKLYHEGEEKGYENWLRSNDDMDTDFNKNVTMATMADEFDKKKSKIRSMIVKEDIKELSSNGISSYDLSMDAPSNFSSDIFSSLPYQDLRQAHMESVIPVTDEDYENTPKFKNINEFISHRNNQETKPLSEIQALEYLNNRNKKDDEMATSRAYQLAKQTEVAKQKNKEFWTSMQLLQNDR